MKRREELRDPQPLAHTWELSSSGAAERSARQERSLQRKQNRRGPKRACLVPTCQKGRQSARGTSYHGLQSRETRIKNRLLLSGLADRASDSSVVTWVGGWPRATGEPVGLRSKHPLRCAKGLRASAAWLLTPPARRVQRASKPHRGLRAPNGTGQAQRREANTARGLGLHNADACVLARNGSEQRSSIALV